MHNIFKILQDIRFTLLTNTILIAHDWSDLLRKLNKESSYPW